MVNPSAPDNKPYYFVSHASADNAALRPIAIRLAGRGIRLLIDEPRAKGIGLPRSENIIGLPYGDDYDVQIRAGIGRAAGLLVLVSEAAYKSPYVNKEIYLAKFLAERGDQFKTLPILMASGDDGWADKLGIKEHGFQLEADGSGVEGFSFNAHSEEILEALAEELLSHAEAFRAGGRAESNAAILASPSVDRLSRISAFPVGSRRPRPVNLFLAIGLNRQPSIAVTVGVDATELLAGLRATESLVAECAGAGFGARTWTLDDQGRPEADAWGQIWPTQDPSEMEIASVVAAMFRRPRPDCGDALVIALPSGAGERAQSIVSTISGPAPAARQSPHAAGIRIHAWTRDRTEATDGAPDPGLDGLVAALSSKVGTPADPDARSAHTMRWDAGGESEIWRRASAEALRLHDLSVASSAQADNPLLVEADRAIAIIAGAAENPNLLHSLAFIPVSGPVVRALAAAPGLAREVTGLLTSAEMRAYRRRWSAIADAHRPSRSGVLISRQKVVKT